MAPRTTTGYHLPTRWVAQCPHEKSTSIGTAVHCERRFEWQEGYSIFAVSASKLQTVDQYIDRQFEHHRKQTFLEELQELLKKHGVEYEPKYLS